MAPSNPNIDGRSGEYRRRSHAYPSNAIEAAERAASYILSDGPIAKKISVRNRSSSGSGSGSSLNNITKNSNNISASSGNGSFLLRMQRQREALMQRQRREKAFSVKMTAWIFLFVMGLLFLFGGDQQQDQDQWNLDHKARGRRGGVGKKNKTEKVRVPLPPNIERQKQLQEEPGIEGSGIRGRHKKPGNDSKEPLLESNAPPKVVSIADDASFQEKIFSQNHAIPSVLIFTYHTNLLTTPESDLADEEEVALSKNIQSIISLHPDSTVRFLDDNDCLESIRVALGPDTNLTTYFTNEERGMFKADICRGAALYETGGLYFDIDIEARMSLWDVIAPQTEFVTPIVHKDSSHHGGFFQAFIGVTPRHALMKRYLELFVKYYDEELDVDVPLGVYFLRLAYNSIIGEHPDDTIELWQETMWAPDLFPDVKRKTWGERRACKMLVVAPPIESDKFQRKQIVPLYSHANGSRMCGGKDTDKKAK